MSSKFTQIEMGCGPLFFRLHYLSVGGGWKDGRGERLASSRRSCYCGSVFSNQDRGITGVQVSKEPRRFARGFKWLHICIDWFPCSLPSCCVDWFPCSLHVATTLIDLPAALGLVNFPLPKSKAHLSMKARKGLNTDNFSKSLFWLKTSPFTFQKGY
jgi:hypothetical protein